MYVIFNIIYNQLFYLLRVVLAVNLCLSSQHNDRLYKNIRNTTMPYIIKIATHNIMLTYLHIFMYIVICHASNARLCIYCHSSIQRTSEPRRTNQYKAFQSIVDETGVSCNTRATYKTTDANYFAVCSSTVLNLSDMICLDMLKM